MLDTQVLITEEKITWHKSFLPQKVVRHEVWTWEFLEKAQLQMTISTEKWSRLFTQMNGCYILFSHNLWFKVEEVKTQQGLL